MLGEYWILASSMSSVLLREGLIKAAVDVTLKFPRGTAAAAATEPQSTLFKDV